MNNDDTVTVVVERSIVIHQPNPEPKINAILLQKLSETLVSEPMLADSGDLTQLLRILWYITAL